MLTINLWTFNHMIYCQKRVKNVGELALNKDLFHNKQQFFASNGLKLSATDLTYILSTLVNVDK